MFENLQEIKFHLQQGILAIEALEKLQDKQHRQSDAAKKVIENAQKTMYGKKGKK